MSKKRKSEKSSDALAGEDAELWQRVTQSAEPLKRGRNRAMLHEAGVPAKPVPERKTLAPAKRTPAIDRPKAPPPKPPPPPLGTYDRREARGLGAGRIDIDARVDLHGMRQREAHAALIRFVQQARAQGHRHLLVITGKGAPRGGRESERPFGEEGEGPGVLRRAVPRWLEEPEFRAAVVGYTKAAPRHGGEGALYVRLRRADRGG